MTKEVLEAYLYLMENIFPLQAPPIKVLKTKDLIEKYFATHFGKGEGKNFRKTIDRNLNYIREIRMGTMEKMYTPKKDSLNVFVDYHLKLKEHAISFEEFIEKYKQEIRAYSEENPMTDEVIAELFPKLPEKLVGIEKRISKIEDFIASNDGFIENLFSKPEHLNNLSTNYSSQKLSLDFLNFLQRELLETKKQYQRAKLLYRNLGSIGLFIVPLKYAFHEERGILQEFFGEELGLDDDLWDDII